MKRPIRPVTRCSPALLVLAGLATAGPLPPTFPPLGDQRVVPGGTLAVRVAPTDPDGPVPGLYLAAGPAGASLDDNGDGTRTLRWSAPDDASGARTFSLVAIDAEDGARRTTLELRVLIGARPGTDAALGLDVRAGYVARVGEPFAARFAPTDSNGGVPSLIASGLPRGASFVDNRDGTRSILWTPGADDPGRYPIVLDVIAAGDPSRRIAVETAIEVRAADGEPAGPDPDPDVDTGAPRVVLPASVAVEAGETVAFTVSATMPSGAVASLNALTPPAGSSFEDAGDGTRRFVWPTEGVPVGRTALRFAATDPVTGARAEGEVAVDVLAGDGGGPDGGGDADVVVDGPIASLTFSGARLSPAFSPDVDRYRLDAGFLQPTLAPIVNGAGLAAVDVPLGASTLRVASRADGRTRTVDVRRSGAGSFVQTALLRTSGFDVAILGDTMIAGDEAGARVFERVNGRWAYADTLGACRDASISFDGVRVALAGRASLIDGIGCDAGGAPVAVYRRDGTGWTRERAFTGAEDDSAVARLSGFGDSVSIDGDRLAVGSLRARVPGPDGAERFDAGAATLYARVDGAWTFERTVVASNADRDDNFGERVALEGDLLAVAAPHEQSAATGVNGDRFDNSYAGPGNTVFSSGAVYLFERGADGWVETTYLKPSDNAAPFYRFGRGLDLDSGTVAVGAPLAVENPDALEFGPTGGLLNRTRGRVYLFERDGDTWRQGASVDPVRDDDAGFGSDVALDGGALAVLSSLRTTAFARTPGADGYGALGGVDATGTAIDLDAGALAVERYRGEGVSVYDDL